MKPTYEQLEGRVKELEVEALERRKIENALRESESKYKALVETIHEVIYAIDEQGLVTYINPAIERVLGYSPVEIIHKPFAEFVHGEDLPIMKKRVQEIYSGELKSSEYRLVHKNGDIRWIRVSSEPVFQDNQPAGLKGVLIDITESKRMEEALRQSEEKFRNLADQSPNMIFINRKGRVVYVNKKCEEILGFYKEEFYSPDFDFRNLIAPESKDTIEAHFCQHMNGEDIDPYEYTLVTRNGRKIEAINAPKLIPYEGGTAILGIVTDITDRKRAEDALRESESKFRSFFDLSPLAVSRTHFESGKIIDVNQRFCEYCKLPREEVLGRTPVELGFYSSDNREDFLNALREYKEVNGLEAVVKATDGTVYTTLMYARLLETEGDTFILTIFQDITEKKRLEAQLQQAQKMESIGTLAGGVAHDFNNLLMGIQGRASLMLLGMNASDPNYEHLTAIEDYVANAADLTKQLLGFARAGKYKVKPIDLNEILHKTSRMFWRTKKEISIHHDYSKDLWPVEVDQTQIEQVLLNLYVNAWQAMPGTGEIFIRTENIYLEEGFTKPYQIDDGEYIKLTLTDTGIGMDKLTQQKIFDPFFTTKKKGRGTGLGLASAYGIIRSHNGIIDVHSKLDEGTTFNIYLPASEKKVSREEEELFNVLMGSETILIIDDEQLIIDVGQEILKILGYEVLFAKGGKHAIEVYKQNRDKIDLVILDMIMPGMGGRETFDKLKEITPDVKVILSSGYSLDGQAKAILDRGCDGFIQKPFNISLLSHKLREILDEV